MSMNRPTDSERKRDQDLRCSECDKGKFTSSSLDLVACLHCHRAFHVECHAPALQDCVKLPGCFKCLKQQPINLSDESEARNPSRTQKFVILGKPRVLKRSLELDEPKCIVSQPRWPSEREPVEAVRRKRVRKCCSTNIAVVVPTRIDPGRSPRNQKMDAERNDSVSSSRDVYLRSPCGCPRLSGCTYQVDSSSLATIPVKLLSRKPRALQELTPDWLKRKPTSPKSDSGPEASQWDSAKSRLLYTDPQHNSPTYLQGNLGEQTKPKKDCFQKKLITGLVTPCSESGVSVKSDRSIQHDSVSFDTSTQLPSNTIEATCQWPATSISSINVQSETKSFQQHLSCNQLDYIIHNNPIFIDMTPPSQSKNVTDDQLGKRTPASHCAANRSEIESPGRLFSRKRLKNSYNDTLLADDRKESYMTSGSDEIRENPQGNISFQLRTGVQVHTGIGLRSNIFEGLMPGKRSPQADKSTATEVPDAVPKYTGCPGCERVRKLHDSRHLEALKVSSRLIADQGRMHKAHAAEISQLKTSKDAEILRLQHELEQEQRKYSQLRKRAVDQTIKFNNLNKNFNEITGEEERAIESIRSILGSDTQLPDHRQSRPLQALRHAINDMSEKFKSMEKEISIASSSLSQAESKVRELEGEISALKVDLEKEQWKQHGHGPPQIDESIRLIGSSTSAVPRLELLEAENKDLHHEPRTVRIYGESVGINAERGIHPFARQNFRSMPLGAVKEALWGSTRNPAAPIRRKMTFGSIVGHRVDRSPEERHIDLAPLSRFVSRTAKSPFDAHSNGFDSNKTETETENESVSDSDVGFLGRRTQNRRRYPALTEITTSSRVADHQVSEVSKHPSMFSSSPHDNTEGADQVLKAFGLEPYARPTVRGTELAMLTSDGSSNSRSNRRKSSYLVSS